MKKSYICFKKLSQKKKREKQKLTFQFTTSKHILLTMTLIYKKIISKIKSVNTEQWLGESLLILASRQEKKHKKLIHPAKQEYILPLEQ